MSDTLIAAIAEQERVLVLDQFDETTAFKLGCAIHKQALAIKAPVTIEIRSAARRYFFATLLGATPENEDWGRRKGTLCCAPSNLQCGLDWNMNGMAVRNGRMLACPTAILLSMAVAFQ